MKVFVTGATGFIGDAVVRELISAGHKVIGLTRSDAGAAALQALGADVHRGTLEHPATLQAGAEQAEAVIHCAFDHDFSNFAANCEKDARVIAALGETLVDTARPLIITSGTGMGSPGHGQLAVETVFDAHHPNPRRASEVAGQTVREKGVDLRVVRLPQVHNIYKQGLITPMIELSREKGVVAYAGEGLNRFPAAHVQDVAQLYRLVLERGTEGGRYHAVAEEGVAMREIAASLGRRLELPTRSLAPDEVQAHFGWLAMFAAFDMAASSARTREQLGWQPKGPGLLEDLDRLAI